MQPYINIFFAYLLFKQVFTITQKPNAAYVTIKKLDLQKVYAKILATKHVFSNPLLVYASHFVKIPFRMYEREYHLIL